MYKSILTLSGLCAMAAATAIDLSKLSAEEFVKRQYPAQGQVCGQYTHSLHVIATPGEGNANPPMGLIGSLSAKILQQIPGSTNATVPYDHANTNGVQQSDAGASTLRTYIQQYQSACPYTRIALLGYSAGAVITMNVLCGETQPPYPRTVAPLSIPTYSGNLVAAVTYGDETHTAGADYNHGTCRVSGPHPRSAVAQGNCEKWSAILRNYCDSDDDMCCTTGTTNAAHYTYPQRYDNEAANFVVSQARARGL